MPLTCTPSTMLVPTPAKVDVPLNMLLAKLSINIPKSIVEEEVEGTVGTCSSPYRISSPDG